MMTRWSVTSAVVGATLWLAAPFVPFGAPPSFGSVEHTFVVLPLVAAPLALLLVAWMLEHLSLPHRLARYAQPVAAILVLASLYVPKGRLAGALAAGWALVTLLVAAGGVRRASKRSLSLLAAHIFLPVGAAWLVMSRLGIGPRSLTPATVFHAAVHFHFSGFMLQILVAATGITLLREGRAWSTALQRGLALGAVLTIPLIAAGNLAQVALLKALGVAVMVASTIALVITTTAASRRAPVGSARLLLRASAASLAAGMILAAVYGAGELYGRGWLSVSRMAAMHGSLNALGFALCGLLGHVRIYRLTDSARALSPWPCRSRP